MSVYVLDVECADPGSLFGDTTRQRVTVTAADDDRAALSAMWTVALAGHRPIRVHGVGSDGA